MYILRAFCALTIASLCTEVEAYWHHLAGSGYSYRWYTKEQAADKVIKFDDDYDDREYTGTETVYFKVICTSSPVIINNIKVDVKSGNFKLSAKSATSNICSGQTSECRGTKQIQEKEFFITVKPNPEFTGGQLKLKLAQAGKVYLINHEGARLHENFGVMLYSGYHPVKFPDKLPQYKVTCKGNCQISQIFGFGYNFYIALARVRLSIWQNRCTYCYCTTERDGHSVFCKKSGANSFIIGSSSFYVTLYPGKEGNLVIDAEVAINVANIKSVTKAGYPYRY